MTDQLLHAVAFGYRNTPDIIFNDLIEEFDLALTEFGMSHRTIDLDNDDVAILRSPLADVGVSFVSSDVEGETSYLLILFGHGTDAFENGMPHGLARQLYHGVMRQLSETWPFDTIHRASFDGLTVSASLIDQLSEELLLLPDLSETDLGALKAILATKSQVGEKAHDPMTLDALRDFYEKEETNVRRMMAESRSTDHLIDLFHSAFSGPQGAIGKLSGKAKALRRLMLETNYPFDPTPLDDAKAIRKPQRSLIFGDLFLRNTWTRDGSA